jgi:predicted enzyme related to lactoylglutathione lyase
MAVKDQVGSFCWWSLMTKDEARANDFYQTCLAGNWKR